MENVEAEVSQLKSQLQDLKSEQRAKDEAAEREMYEEGIRCNKMVAQARMEGMNTDAVERALKQRVQRMDKQGNRIGLSQMESLVTLLLDTMRGGHSRQRQRVEPKEVEETRAAEELQLPQVPAGARAGQTPRRRGRKTVAFAPAKDDKPVEFPLVPMPSSSRTNKVRALANEQPVRYAFVVVRLPCPGWCRCEQESYARWRWQFDGQYGGPGRVHA